MNNDDTRLPSSELFQGMLDRLEGRGLGPSMAAATARILVEADLLGHRTHGLALLPIYLDCIDKGYLAKAGEAEVLNQRGAVELWEGHRLAGAWLVTRAIARAEEMARVHGTGTIVIRQSFHIGCLAAYLEDAAQRGLVLVLECSAPQAATVAPFGGKTPVLSPSPLAIGYPTVHGPVMIDISTSVTSNSFVRKVAREGGRLPHPWVIGADGQATTDPEASEVILPLGGIEAGHKGFGMGLRVEALTAGLAGKGRADETVTMGGTVFLQVFDPEAFGGLEAMGRVMGHVSDLCHAALPIDPAHPVRLPGEAGLRRKADQLENGVVVEKRLLDWLNGVE